MLVAASGKGRKLSDAELIELIDRLDIRPCIEQLDPLPSAVDEAFSLSPIP